MSEQQPPQPQANQQPPAPKQPTQQQPAPQQPAQQQPAPQQPAQQQPAQQQPAQQQPAPQQPTPQQPAQQQPTQQQPPQPQADQQPPAPQQHEPQQSAPPQQPNCKDLSRLRFWCNLIFYIIFIVVLILGGYFLWENTKPPKEPQAIKELIQAIKEKGQPITTHRLSKENTKVEQEFKDSYPSYYRKHFRNSSVESVKTTVESSKEEDIPECYTIRKDDLDNALKSVALASRQEVSDEYHKNFSLLISIITLFGIGFPIIIALIQSRINEKELDKVAEVAKNAEKAITDVNTAFDNYKNEIIDTNIILYGDIRKLFGTLSDIYINQINTGCNNLYELLIAKTTVYYIMEGESSLRNMKQGQKRDNFITHLSEITERTNRIIQCYEKLKDDSNEIIPYKKSIVHLIDFLKEYRSVLIKIKSSVPEDFHNEIDQLQNMVQNALSLANRTFNILTLTDN